MFSAATWVGWIGGDSVYRKVAAKNICIYMKMLSGWCVYKCVGHTQRVDGAAAAGVWGGTEWYSGCGLRADVRDSSPAHPWYDRAHRWQTTRHSRRQLRTTIAGQCRTVARATSYSDKKENLHRRHHQWFIALLKLRPKALCKCNYYYFLPQVVKIPGVKN